MVQVVLQIGMIFHYVKTTLTYTRDSHRTIRFEELNIRDGDLGMMKEDWQPVFSKIYMKHILILLSWQTKYGLQFKRTYQGIQCISQASKHVYPSHKCQWRGLTLTHISTCMCLNVELSDLFHQDMTQCEDLNVLGSTVFETTNHYYNANDYFYIILNYYHQITSPPTIVCMWDFQSWSTAKMNFRYKTLKTYSISWSSATSYISHARDEPDWDLKYKRKL